MGNTNNVVLYGIERQQSSNSYQYLLYHWEYSLKQDRIYWIDHDKFTVWYVPLYNFYLKRQHIKTDSSRILLLLLADMVSRPLYQLNTALKIE